MWLYLFLQHNEVYNLLQNARVLRGDTIRRWRTVPYLHNSPMHPWCTFNSQFPLSWDLLLGQQPSMDRYRLPLLRVRYWRNATTESSPVHWTRGHTVEATWGQAETMTARRLTTSLPARTREHLFHIDMWSSTPPLCSSAFGVQLMAIEQCTVESCSCIVCALSKFATIKLT